MAALANLILAIAIAILLPLLQYIAPAAAANDAAPGAVAAAEIPAAPEAADAPTPAAADRKVCVWTTTCPENPAEARSVQILIEKVRAESPCKSRVLELAEPAAPTRFVFTTT